MHTIHVGIYLERETLDNHDYPQQIELKQK
jgi:hypothetical protein